MPYCCAFFACSSPLRPPTTHVAANPQHTPTRPTIRPPTYACLLLHPSPTPDIPPHTYPTHPDTPFHPPTHIHQSPSHTHTSAHPYAHIAYTRTIPHTRTIDTHTPHISDAHTQPSSDQHATDDRRPHPWLPSVPQVQVYLCCRDGRARGSR